MALLHHFACGLTPWTRCPLKRARVRRRGTWDEDVRARLLWDGRATQAGGPRHGAIEYLLARASRYPMVRVLRIYARVYLLITGDSTAVLLMSSFVRDFFLSFARLVIYTTSLSNTAVFSALYSFNLLGDGIREKVSLPLHYPTYKITTLLCGEAHYAYS
jgi:hypothetical protein